jgi:hypothetical protein
MTEQIISDLQARNSGLEDNLDKAGARIQVLEDRERRLKSQLQQRSPAEYVVEQLKIKLEVYEKALAPKLSYPIFEPSSTPTVQWVAFSDFKKCMNSLKQRLDAAEKELEAYHVGRP